MKRAVIAGAAVATCLAATLGAGQANAGKNVLEGDRVSYYFQAESPTNDLKFTNANGRTIVMRKVRFNPNIGFGGPQRYWYRTNTYVVNERISVASGQVATKSSWAYCRIDINKKTYLNREARGKGAVARC